MTTRPDAPSPLGSVTLVTGPEEFLNERVVHAVDFVSDDPVFSGTMTMTWEVSPAPEGSLVEFRAQRVAVRLRGPPTCGRRVPGAARRARSTIR